MNDQVKHRELKRYYRAIPLYGSNYKIEELNLYGRNQNCFLSREEAEDDFLKSQEIALSKYSQILDGLETLREKLCVDFHFDYYMEGDTHGIYEEGGYIAFTINGYNFKFLQ